MPKACLNCGTDNRDEALFCRRCGTPFSSSQASPSTAEPTLPGRWSARDATAPVRPAPPDAVGRPPPDNTASTAGRPFDDEDEDDEALSPGAEATVVIPQPPRGGGRPTDGGLSPQPVPLEGADTPVMAKTAAAVPPAVRHSPASAAGTTGATKSTTATRSTGSTNRAGFWSLLAVGMLLIAGLGFWLLGPRTPKPLADEPASAAGGAIAPQPTASSAAVAGSPAVSPAVSPTVPATLSTGGAAPAGGSPLPDEPADRSTTSSALAGAPAPALAASVVSAEDEAKAAKLKLERAARLKALREQRDPATAKKTEQDATAQRQPDERTRGADPATSPAGPVRASAAPASTRPGATAQEICAGRGTIATAVCESLQCGKPEHANEARCRQVNAEEERRR